MALIVDFKISQEKTRDRLWAGPGSWGRYR
jgi:hypothetical protein